MAVSDVFTCQQYVLRTRHSWRAWLLGPSIACLVACAGVAGAPSVAAPRDTPSVVIGVPGADAQKLTPEYWIQRLEAPDSTVLDTQQIAAQNARLAATDPSVADLTALPATLKGEDVRQRVLSISSPPTRTLYNSNGEEITAAALHDLGNAVAIDRISTEVAPRFGLVTQRADLRTFPTAQRVFSRPGDTDIDRFQESALFPGTPVAVLHESRDGQWWFVASRLYSAWIQANTVAIGARDEVLAYASRTPYLIVTGAQARTVFTPEAPQVSDVVLDMSVRVPLLADWPTERPVNGQFAYASHVVALPVRDAQGQLEIMPALIPRSADVRTTGYLPLTRANLITQAFKLLGERYGWGHSYGTRDCSGFVSEIYRSFGVEMPRNTRDQGVSPAFSRIAFSDADDYATRAAVLRSLDVGDLIYIPGHVMMVIGQEEDETWLIHDTTGIRYRTAQGDLVSVPLNQVAVTPLFPLLGESGTPFVDFIYSVQRIRLTGSK